MAKRVQNPIILHVKFVDGAVENTTVDYGLVCDDGLETRDYLPPTLSPTQENDLLDILNEALVPQINTKEGIS